MSRPGPLGWMPASEQNACTSAPQMLNAELELDTLLALRWLDSMMHAPQCKHTREEAVYLTACRQLLVAHHPMSAPPTPPAPWWANLQKRYMPGEVDLSLSALGKEVSNSMFDWPNLPANGVAALQFADALFFSLPATMRIRMAGGTYELYDANRDLRNKARGKAAKAKYPPRMKLRVKNVPLNSLRSLLIADLDAGRAGFARQGGKLVAGVQAAEVVAARGGQALTKAKVGANELRAMLTKTGLGKVVMVPQHIHGKIPLRGIVGGNAVGAALTFGPTLYKNASESGLLSGRHGDGEAWKDFAIQSAHDQSGNAAGLLASAAVGAVLVAAGVTAAPVLILVGLTVGIAGQTAFNFIDGDKLFGNVVSEAVGRGKTFR